MSSVKRLSTHIEKKGYFRTDAGLVYKNALREYIKGYNPSDCIYCGEKLPEDCYLICKNCNDKLISRAVEDIKELPNSELDGSVIVNKDIDVEINQDTDINIDTGIDSDVDVGIVGQGTEYKKKQPIKRFVSISVCVALAVGLAVIGIIIFWRMSLIQNDVIAAESDSKKEIIQFEDEETTSVDDLKNATINTVDGFDFLGSSYNEIATLMGDSEDVVDASTKYFKSCGVSVIVDGSTGRIIYVDNDGTGDGSIVIPIFGILPGCSYEEARNIFIEKGIDTVDYADDSFMCMFQIGGSNIKYEIDITKDTNNRVAIVAATLH